MSKFFTIISRSINHQAMSGILLGFSTLCALCVRNMFWSDLYIQWLNTPLFTLSWILGVHHFHVIDIINQGLMVCFFALVSIEIKKEFLVGVFRDVRYAILPCTAAIGGVVVPALFFLLFNSDNSILRNGWAIPTTTDIAFSLGILSLLGKKVPISLRIFLTTLAVVDDLCAVLIIALVYTSTLQWIWLGFSFLLISFLYILSRFNIQTFAPYMLTGLLFWWVVLRSGIHVTVAGVLWSAFIPLHNMNHDKRPPLLYRVEHYLRPMVDYVALPAFAFANAGLPLSGIDLSSIMHPLFLGILVGLTVGKPLGILLGSGLVLVTGRVSLPIGMSKRHLVSISCLGGVGFTMSLLIGLLALPEGYLLILARQAILISSLFSAVLGLFIFPKTNTGLFSHYR